jgi:hypothetical protein
VSLAIAALAEVALFKMRALNRLRNFIWFSQVAVCLIAPIGFKVPATPGSYARAWGRQSQRVATVENRNASAPDIQGWIPLHCVCRVKIAI